MAAGLGECWDVSRLRVTDGHRSRGVLGRFAPAGHGWPPVSGSAGTSCACGPRMTTGLAECRNVLRPRATGDRRSCGCRNVLRLRATDDHQPRGTSERFVPAGHRRPLVPSGGRTFGARGPQIAGTWTLNHDRDLSSIASDVTGVTRPHADTISHGLIPTSHHFVRPRTPSTWCAVTVAGAKSMRDLGGGGGCMQVPFGLPSAQVPARRTFGTCFGREQVPFLLLDQRSHLTRARSRRSSADLVAPWRERYATHARSTAVRGPAAQTVRRARVNGGRWWPGGARGTPCARKWWSSVARGARGTPCTPGRRSLVARWRETYAAQAQLVVVGGPAAREVRRARGQRSFVARRRETYAVHARGRRWPGGANRLSIPSEPRTSLARRRQPDRRPQVTPPRSPLRTN